MGFSSPWRNHPKRVPTSHRIFHCEAECLTASCDALRSIGLGDWGSQDDRYAEEGISSPPAFAHNLTFTKSLNKVNSFAAIYPLESCLIDNSGGHGLNVFPSESPLPPREHEYIPPISAGERSAVKLLDSFSLAFDSDNRKPYTNVRPYDEYVSGQSREESDAGDLTAVEQASSVKRHKSQNILGGVGDTNKNKRTSYYEIPSTKERAVIEGQRDVHQKCYNSNGGVMAASSSIYFESDPVSQCQAEIYRDRDRRKFHPRIFKRKIDRGYGRGNNPCFPNRWQGDCRSTYFSADEALSGAGEVSSDESMFSCDDGLTTSQNYVSNSHPQDRPGVDMSVSSNCKGTITPLSSYPRQAGGEDANNFDLQPSIHVKPITKSCSSTIDRFYSVEDFTKSILPALESTLNMRKVVNLNKRYPGEVETPGGRKRSDALFYSKQERYKSKQEFQLRTVHTKVNLLRHSYSAENSEAEDASADVMIETQDRVFLAHKSVLVSRSKYFAQLFSGMNKSNYIVRLKRFPSQLVSLMIEYIYSGRDVVPEGVDLEEAVCLATKLQLDQLTAKIFRHLEESILAAPHSNAAPNLNKIIDLLILSQDCEMEDVTYRCITAIGPHFKSVLDMPKFMDLPPAIIYRCFIHALSTLDAPNLLEIFLLARKISKQKIRTNLTSTMKIALRECKDLMEQ